MKKVKNLKYYILDFFIFFILYLLFDLFNWLIFIYLFVFILYLFFRYKLYKSSKKIGSYLSLYSVYGVGYKGAGKDLLNQRAVITLYKKSYDKTVNKIKKYFDNKEKLLKFTKNYHDLENSFLLVESYLSIDDFIFEWFYQRPNYLSNIDYGYGCRIVELSEFKLISKNTGKEITSYDMIDDIKNVKLENYNPLYENLNLIISDGSIYFPNTEHNILAKYYPSLPIFFSLSRHLYNMNIIVNTQLFNGVWVKLRGQQDLYINAVATSPRNKSISHELLNYLPFFRKYLLSNILVYTKYESAELGMLPYTPSLGIKDRSMIRAERDLYHSQHGEIKRYYYIIRKKDIIYDTRVFKKMMVDTE